ncbi:MAG: hypothetical protein OXH15_10815 [Gammaproteobacteria bacterium]|nr:hypothetical protein [Gammaproteobacteria bacterium]
MPTEPSAGEREGPAPRKKEPSAGEREGLSPREEEPTYIEPVAAPLTRSGGRGRAIMGGDAGKPLSRLSARALWFTVVMILLGGALAYVVISLPDRVATPTAQAPANAANGSAPRAEARPASDDIVPPFRAEQIALAREQAREKLRDFVDLQLTLENDFNIAAWGADELARVKDRANTADALFIDERFDDAIDEYAGALADLQALAAKGETLFEGAVSAGLEALAARDAEAARQAFDRALAMRPEDGRAAAGARRAARLPDVIAALREAERAILRDDYDEASSHVAEARRLDPATTGLKELSAQIASARIAKLRDAQLSDAFAALAAGRHGAALDAFDQVLKGNPAHPTALAGRQQTVQAQTLAAIDDLRAKALAEAQAEDWEAALSSYDAVLAIDPSLQFARDGKARIRERVMLIRAMDAVLADPGRLSSDQEFAAAKETLRSATEQADAGAAFEKRLADFRDLVTRSAEPIPLILVSDNATEVTIHKVGVLGAFERHELALRPGRYVIVGSQVGCRDVRKEIVLSSGMAPVDIRCAERI